jgi:hypothetical protein
MIIKPVSLLALGLMLAGALTLAGCDKETKKEFQQEMIKQVKEDTVNSLLGRKPTQPPEYATPYPQATSYIQP